MTTSAVGILQHTDFDEFFRAVNGGNSPFAWQSRLVASILDGGRWPDRIAAPTGAGKSSVVDVHVFLNALHGVGGGPRVPRRLSVVVNRRGLVDSHADRAAALAVRISHPGGDRVLMAVRSGLLALRAVPLSDDTNLDALDPGEVLPLTQLRGGLPPDSSWLDDPSRCAVVCATPDMWGSRLLFRGYGSTRFARPREAGMLAYDSVMVLDEAHLNRQLLVTARRIADLEREAPERIGVPVLQVVETTATPGQSRVGGQREVGVTASDIESGSAEVVLARRLTTPKPLRIVESGNWPAKRKPGKAYWDELSALVVDHHERLGTAGLTGRTVGCVVNTVATALAVAQRLRGKGLRVVTLVGRMRRVDSERIKGEHSGLFSPAGDDGVDVLVSTQTLEVGIDADLAALVTELAPGAAVAQRAGRVNRLGLRGDVEIVVLGPEEMQTWPEQVGPYSGADLEAAAGWLERRSVSADGLSPWSLVDDPPPGETLGRTLLQRPELWDAWGWARSSDALAADGDLALWLRDSLQEETAGAGIVVRERLPEDDNAALGLLRETAPEDAEVFPCTLGVARRRLEIVLDSSVRHHARAFVHRAGETAVWSGDDRLRPGDVLILDAVHPVAREYVAVDEDAAAADDVYADVTGGTVETIVYDHAGDADRQLLKDVTEMSRTDAADLVRSMRSGSTCREVYIGSADTHPEATHAASWIVLKGAALEQSNEETRQEWTSAAAQVELGSHNQAVAERSRRLSDRLGLHGEVGRAVELAGLHHDDGKADLRFQRLLGGTDVALAKSGRRSAQHLRVAKAAGGLPVGWRHEQMSVVLASAGADDTRHTNLVLRLVGTSHGRGRPGFPHTAAQLLGAEDQEWAAAAAELFDHGSWDSLIEDTHDEWGVWGAAYLEALLRAADGQISREGR